MSINKESVIIPASVSRVEIHFFGVKGSYSVTTFNSLLNESIDAGNFAAISSLRRDRSFEKSRARSF